jgi:PEP-CTERM motif
MNTKNWLAGIAAIGALAFGTQAAEAALVCTGCGYDDAAAGTYVGLYNPDNFDFGTFQHSDVGIANGPNTGFEDFWVFDVDPPGSGSISADFTAFTSISGFTGQLFADGGSTCAGNTCSSIVTGGLLATENSVNRRWEIMANSLPAGRYILLVTGTTNGNGTSAYTGQLAFIREPGTLALLGLGLFGMGVSARRRS